MIGLGIGLAFPNPLVSLFNPTLPVGITLNSIIGNNDLYTVPANRCALITDVICTNPTAGAITYYPQIKIGGNYFPLGESKTESAGGIGHNYGMYSINFSSPIVLNAGESFSINAITTAGGSFWTNIVEYDATSKLQRAFISAWSTGNNTLITVPANKGLVIGSIGFAAVNNPTVEIHGINYVNLSGGTRTLNGIYAVPNAGAPSTQNQIAGSNSIINGNGFCKYFHGGLNPGDSIVLNIDAGTATQFAWLNYAFLP
jgi:hypothetical protein